MVKKHAASDTSSHFNTEVKCNLDRTALALVTAWELTGAARMGFDTILLRGKWTPSNPCTTHQWLMFFWGLGRSSVYKVYSHCQWCKNYTLTQLATLKNFQLLYDHSPTESLSHSDLNKKLSPNNRFGYRVRVNNTKA